MAQKKNTTFKPSFIVTPPKTKTDKNCNFLSWAFQSLCLCKRT